MTLASLKRGIADLHRRLPQRPLHHDPDELHAFDWLTDDELVRCEELMGLMGGDDPEALLAEAEFLHLLASGEARRARGEPTVVERHLARWAIPGGSPPR